MAISNPLDTINHHKNAVERAVILCGDGEIDADDLGFDLFEGAQIADSGVEHVAGYEKIR